MRHTLGVLENRVFFAFSAILAARGALKSKRCSRGHLRAGKNLYLRKNGTRECRQCSLKRSAARRKQHNCPDCGQACYCGGDVGDIDTGDVEAAVGYTHCAEDHRLLDDALRV